MTDKRSIGSRIFILADQYNIEQVRVSSIISSYISLCRDLIVDGFEVTFSDLVTVVPDSNNVRYKTTLAYQCKKVAESCGISYHTVFAIIKGYLVFLKEDVMSGVSVDIRGIVSLHPILSDGIVTKVHSSISASIKRDIELRRGYSTNVRVHTHKVLKRSIKGNIIIQEVVA